MLDKSGFFLVENFFDPDLCSQLCAEIATSILAPCTIGVAGKFVVDRQFRRVGLAKINDVIVALVKARLMDLKPRLERYFCVAIRDCNKPQFLHYVKDDFYKQHRDNSGPLTKARRVSAVIFLNEASLEPGSYGGGALTFYDGERSYPLAAKKGLLVCFRSDILHGVSPVMHGDRYTIVTWYF